MVAVLLYLWYSREPGIVAVLLYPWHVSSTSSPNNLYFVTFAVLVDHGSEFWEPAKPQKGNLIKCLSCILPCRHKFYILELLLLKTASDTMNARFNTSIVCRGTNVINSP